MTSGSPTQAGNGFEHGETVAEAAAQRVAARLHVHFPQGSSEDFEYLRRRLATLVVGVSQSGDGGGQASHPGYAFSPADEILLDALQAEMLDLPVTVADPAVVLRGLRALARYRDSLPSAPSRGDSHSDLPSRMLGPDAFTLLVEVAHDFRSPLTSILFLAETLRDGHSGEVNDLQRSQLGLMYSAAFGLANVASDVIDLARRGRDLVDEDPSPYAFAEVFRSVERMINPMVEEKGLELRVNLPAHGHARGHPHALARVILNLTTNALKFTDEGYVEIGVVQLPQGRVEYYVKDTGRGIPADRQAELFEPFKKRRGHENGGEFFSGSGVGLSIARRLVEAMGAKLEFTTSDAEGTRFHFVLPPPSSR